LGGFSDYNPLTFQQRDALIEELGRRAIEATVVCGFRNWTPWYSDGLLELEAAGCDVVLPMVMTAQSSEGYYRGMLAAAQRLEGKLSYEFLPCAATIAGRPGWIAASAARIQDVTADWSDERRAGARLLLTAHAIPQAIERRAPEYRQQFESDAAAVAQAAGWDAHSIGFQSAPDEEAAAWSQPMMDDVVDQHVAGGAKEIICHALGFLVDHVEVKFDLDTELKEQCAAAGIGYNRALCVHDHPAFIGELADIIGESLAGVS
jgi:ferrochelatase